LTINPAPIPSAAITVTAPVTGAAPSGTAGGGTSSFTVGIPSWSPAGSIFLGETAYTVTVILTANNGYTFTGTNATMNEITAQIANNGAEATVFYIFGATQPREPRSISIKTQPALVYTHGEALNLSALEVTIMHNDGTTLDVTYPFAGQPITTNLAHGLILSRQIQNNNIHNNNPVTVTYEGLTSVNTAYLTVNQRALTITAVVHTKEYDGETTAGFANPAGMITLDGVLTGETVTPYAVIANYINANAGTTTLNVTSVTLQAGDHAGNYTVTPSGGFTVEGITRRTAIITPVALNKTFGAADPTLTFTSNPALVTNNSTTGALIRETGEDVGAYLISLGDLKSDPNYTFILSSTPVHFNIIPAPGASVAMPTLNSRTTDSIVINTVTVSGNDEQIVEYFIHTASALTQTELDSDDWVVGQGGTLAFEGLSTGTNYWIFARSRESDNYNRGAPSIGLGVFALRDSNINIIFDPIIQELVLPPVNLLLSLSANNSIELSLTGFDSYEWRVNNIIRGTASSFILRASDFMRTDIGINRLTVEAFRGGVPYGLTVNFTVTE
jgi:hypothetical protein